MAPVLYVLLLQRQWVAIGGVVACLPCPAVVVSMTKGSRGCCRAPVECVQSGPEAAHGASMASGAYLAKLAAWYSAGYNGAVQVVQLHPDLK